MDRNKPGSDISKFVAYIIYMNDINEWKYVSVDWNLPAKKKCRLELH